MENLKPNDKITVIYAKNTAFESRIPGYFVEIEYDENPIKVHYHTSALHSFTTLTNIALTSCNSILKGWETANASHVKRELRIEKILKKNILIV
jgi:hypothetical protein